MDMIGRTAGAEGFRARVAADGRKIGVHSGPDVGAQAWMAVFCAEDDVNDDLAERLRHGGTIAEEGFWMNRAFSAGSCACVVPGALPQAHMKAAPLALNRYIRPPTIV